jgi:hypothetical protein
MRARLPGAAAWAGPGDRPARHALAWRPEPTGPAIGARQPLTFSTRPLPPAQQFEAWHAASAGLVAPIALTDPALGFAADRHAWTLGPFALGTVRAPAVRLERDATQVRRSSLDHCLFTVATSGHRRVRVGDSCLDLPPGALNLSSLNAILVSERTDIEGIGLYVPRDTLPEIGAAQRAGVAWRVVLLLHRHGDARHAEPGRTPAAARRR